MNRTVLYVFCVLLVSSLFSGCFIDGPIFGSSFGRGKNHQKSSTTKLKPIPCKPGLYLIGFGQLKVGTSSTKTFRSLVCSDGGFESIETVPYIIVRNIRIEDNPHGAFRFKHLPVLPQRARYGSATERTHVLFAPKKPGIYRAIVRFESAIVMSDNESDLYWYTESLFLRGFAGEETSQKIVYPTRPTLSKFSKNSPTIQVSVLGL